VRRPYLDWLRGIAVLIMIEAHTVDSWTRVADRDSPWYRAAIIVGGFGAPLFLFLAGVASMLAAGARAGKGLTTAEAALGALRRGAWIFLMAFLFRLQSMILGGGQFPQSLLKVDILNVMGVSMMVGAMCLALAVTTTARVLLFTALTAACAMFTPLIRETPFLNGLPDPLEAYLRPLPGLTNFTLFPWAGFFTGGCVVGALLANFQLPTSNPQEHPSRLEVGSWMLGVEQRRLAAVGVALAAAGYLTSYLPPLFPDASFWTSSPTFFFLRLGILVLSVPAAFVVTEWWRGERLQEFGRASLFVYWVHVELVYGVLSAPIHRRLPLPFALAACAVFIVAMFGLVRLKAKVQRKGGRPN
jgi:uncharacterized membrane protein